MRKARSNGGSALLIATVVVLIAVGIGGAFVAVSLTHAKEQVLIIEADEAMTMCDAGMERARQALGVYRAANKPNSPPGPNVWTVDQIIQYCNNSYTNMNTYTNVKFGIVPPKPVDRSQPPDPFVIKADYQRRLNLPPFKDYAGTLWGTNAAVNVLTPGIPIDPGHVVPVEPDPLLSTSGDPGRPVILGWNMPYHKGAIHIHVRNNDDSGTLDPKTGGPGTSDHNTDTTIMVTVTATLPSGLQRQIDGAVNWPPPASNAAFNALGAVVAKDAVNTNGNTTIDGRDYVYDPLTGATATLSGDPGVYGIVSGGAIGVGGSSGVGGKGNPPPAKGAATNSTAPGGTAFTGSYPKSPDDLLNVPSGTLKATAQAQGTYCATQADYDNLLTANGGKLPDQAIIYLDFVPGNGTFELGSGNTRSSILVVHNDSYTGTISQVHGNFTGALFADSIVRVNAGTNITGMVQLFSPTSSADGNVLGNGNSNIRFSSGALKDLPSANPGSTALPLMASRRSF